VSVLTSETQELRFLTRFENVWESLRRYQVRQGLCWTFLAAALALGTLMVADHGWELAWSTRAAGLAVAGCLTLAILWARVLVPIRWWTRPRTAVEIEHRFPQLGQRIRTVVQFAGLPDTLIESEGMAPNLVDALAEETEVRTRPLPLDTVVPWRRIWAAAGLAALPALVLILAVLSDPEWRIALGRVLLGNRPYTTLEVKPGNVTVEQGANVPVAVDLKGRLRRDFILYTRPADQPNSEWKTTSIEPLERGPAGHRETLLEKVKEPLAYRVVAGPAASPIYRIGVRYPLAVRTFDVALQPPSYTGLEPKTVKGGDLQVVEGTNLVFRIVFDTTPAEAALVLIDPSVRSNDKNAAPPRVLPLKREGQVFTAALTPASDLAYRIEARASDGRSLPKNRYRIDVREDRAPRVAFDSPDEALEVHPIAEILHRIRVGDDFGLTKAGIVFQFNNGDEQSLILKDFTPAAGSKPQTTATLEEMLLMEKLAATPTDSVTYYAFAEDNYPSGAKRTETDLRYIDIRPFKREYKMVEPGEGMGSGESTTLGELIARQRFNLNRGVRLAKHQPGDRRPSEDPLKIATFEETLAGLTREFTEGLEGIAGIRIEPLHEAEESMLAAVAAIDRGRNAEAPLNMADALRHLIEARRTVLMAVMDGRISAQALRSFDRTQAQKLRKPKKEQDEAEAIAEEIEQLADDEDFVYATLASLGAEGNPNPEKGEKDAESAKAEKKAEQPDSQGENASKGQEGEKGSETQGKNPGTEKGQGTGKQPGSGTKGSRTNRPEGGTEPKDDDGEGAAERKTDRRREAAERQETIADKARELEERLKKVEAASNLARARMTKAAEATEKVSGALARGNTKEATETAKTGAAMLHELARQVKGEISRESTDELAMARDLAAELAERESEFGKSSEGSSSPEANGENDSEGKGTAGQAGRGDWGGLTDAERLERMDEMAKTLEAFLKGASQRTEGESGERIRELIAEHGALQVVERVERIGDLYVGGQKREARREASEFARRLEMLAQTLDVLHRGIVAPELAALVEFDRRVGELLSRLKTLSTEAEIAEWHRAVATLIRDLEKAGMHAVAEQLAASIDWGAWQGGPIHWTDGALHHWVAPDVYINNFQKVTVQLQQRIQDLILKDLVSARDEATPPEFKELVERYYEVLSKESGAKRPSR
jgi:hypothetical protein